MNYVTILAKLNRDNLMNSDGSKSYSCYDLHNSVFLGPDEIRTCCKRFFSDGIFKGDVVALKVPKDSQTSLEDIKKAKNKIYEELNSENGYDKCNGCPHIQYKDWGGKPLENGIDYLSLEYHSICNMRCSYCSPTYYGGHKSNYPVTSLVNEFIQNNLLEKTNYLVWGGGEPTLDRDFDEILSSIMNLKIGPRIRMITNSTKFSPLIKKGIDEDRIFIVTSIDAGKPDTFKSVRGLNGFEKVFNNLCSYAEDNPKNVIIKYILNSENDNFSEIDCFIEAIQKYKLEECNFQLSSDFKEEVIQSKRLSAIIYLYNKLKSISVRFTFMDDLIIQRMPPINEDLIKSINLQLQNISVDNQTFLSQESLAYSKKIYIVGTGKQAIQMIDRLSYLKLFEEIIFVDPNDSFKGDTLMNYKVIKLDQLTSNCKTIIGAVQSSPFIYNSLESKGLKSTLIRDFII